MGMRGFMYIFDGTVLSPGRGFILDVAMGGFHFYWSEVLSSNQRL